MTVESITTYMNNIIQKANFELFLKLATDDKIVTGIEFLLIFIFLLFSIKLFISWYIDKRQMKILYRLLIMYTTKAKKHNTYGHYDISNSYEELLEDINHSNTKLKKIWKRFDDNLIKRVENKKLNVRNPYNAKYFFNNRTMITHPSYKLFTSVPGMLLLIGLLGAFIGLYFAVTGLSSYDINKLQNSMNILLNILSIYFAQIKQDIGHIEKFVDALQILKNMAGLYLTKANLSASSYKELQESIEILKNMLSVKFAVSMLGLGLSIILISKYKLLEASLERRLGKIQRSIDEIFIQESPQNE